MVIKTRSVVGGILARVTYDMADRCWPWTGHISPRGYGRAPMGDGTQQQAHRVVYELLVGPVPDGLDIDHVCRNKACVNPQHLEPVTKAENSRRQGEARRLAECPKGHSEWGSAMRHGSPRRYCKPCARAAAQSLRDRKKQ